MKGIITTLLIFCFFLISSCKKYEDGPSFSLNSKRTRLANKWKVETFFINGNDKTDFYRTLVLKETLEIFKSGTWQYSETSNWTWAKPYDTGKWNFIDHKEDVEMISDDPSIPYKLFRILKLKSTELWLERTVTPDSIIEFHYVPQLD